MESVRTPPALPVTHSQRTPAVRCLRGLCRLLFRTRVQGVEHLPKKGPYILVANHASYLDGVLMALFAPTPPRIALTRTFCRHPVYGRAIRALQLLGAGTYGEVDPESPFGMRDVIRALRQGQGALIFPEGGISGTGDLQPLQSGAAIVATRTHAPLVPVRIHGVARSIFGRAPATARHWPRPVLEVTPVMRVDTTDVATVTEHLKARLRGAGF